MPARWTAVTSRPHANKYHVAIMHDDGPTPYAKVLRLWQQDAAFRTFFIEVLAQSPFEAFRWETPAVTNATVDQAFECVLLRSDALARKANPSAFAPKFEDGKTISTFSNLGGDATMIVPNPTDSSAQYAHLADFLRHAPPEQTHELWIAVARAMEKRLGDKPVWLSTAGMGVAWLHVRIDDRPKYYGHEPYREF